MHSTCIIYFNRAWIDLCLQGLPKLSNINMKHVTISTYKCLELVSFFIPSKVSSIHIQMELVTVGAYEEIMNKFTMKGSLFHLYYVGLQCPRGIQMGFNCEHDPWQNLRGNNYFMTKQRDIHGTMWLISLNQRNRPSLLIHDSLWDIFKVVSSSI